MATVSTRLGLESGFILWFISLIKGGACLSLLALQIGGLAGISVQPVNLRLVTLVH